MLAELLSDLRYRLRVIFRRGAVERELAQELLAHVEHETEKLVRAGIPLVEAQRRARLAFGGVERIKDDARDVRGLAWLDIAAQDARYAVRALRSRPGFTAAVVATLALGIGANAAMFGVVDGILFRPPAYLRDPSSVNRVYVAYSRRGAEGVGEGIEYPRYQGFVNWTRSFSQMAAFNVVAGGVGSGDAARERPIGIATPSFFEFFDATPAAGRFFDASDGSPSVADRVTVLDYDFWQVEYGGRQDVLGARLAIGPTTYTVIGVAPKHFRGVNDGEAPAVWIPVAGYAASLRPDFATSYNWGWLEVLVRRKPGVTIAAATSDITAAQVRTWLAERAVDPSLESVEKAKPHAILAPTQPTRGPNSEALARAMVLMVAMAIVVMLVACANVANLLLARGFARRREIAVRLAMGVSRGRLLSHLMLESMVLALLGAAGGLAVARLAGASINALLGNGASAPSLFDGRTLLYSAATTIAVGLLTGALPAFHAGRTDVVTDLRSGTRDSGYRRSRVRGALVVVQATLCVVLLVGAGVFMRSLINIRSLPLGFDAGHVLYVSRNMRGVTLTRDQSRALMHRLVEAANVLPGVQGASAAASVPLYDHESTRLVVPGVDSVSRLGRFQMQLGSPGYFATIGTRVLRGRGIEAEDREGSPRIIVVSQTMAHKLWPDRDPLGQCVRVGADTAPCATVVGVAEDIKERGLTHEAESNYYLPVDQYTRIPNGMFVRVRGDATAAAETVRRRLQTVMPGDAYVTTLALSEIVGNRERGWRLGAMMFAAFGSLALVLGAIGLYSVIAFGVEQRSRELGIRIALGARIRGVIALVMGEGLRLTLTGLALGAGLSLLGGRWISTLLFDEKASDPVVFGFVAVTLLVVSFAASVVPALRATRINPSIALRAD
jgi:putative ABC transport system permease protein